MLILNSLKAFLKFLSDAFEVYFVDKNSVDETFKYLNNTFKYDKY